MKKHFKQLMSVVMTAAIVLSMGSGMDFQTAGAADVKSEDTGLHNPVVEMNTCDTVYFGNYWQEDTNGDGVADRNDEKTPIRWRILSRNGNDAYVMADQALDCKPYHETREDITWENSTLRKWLNGEFYQEAFTAEEQEAVLEQTLVNADNEVYGTEGGADTVDRVYLLSYEDIQQEEYGFSPGNADTQARVCRATAYARGQGAFTTQWPDNVCEWWLRSPGSNTDNASDVLDYGCGHYSGHYVYGIGHAVRPALHLNLASPLVRQGGKKEISQKSASWDLVELGTDAGKPITWRVLSVSGNDAFLLSDRILANQAYHETGEDITWKDCTLRSWLNGAFYQDAFSEEEKEGIRSRRYENADNPQFGTEGGEDTTDYLTLLSLQDIINPKYGFPTANCYSPARVANDSIGYPGGWRLRSPGLNTGRASDVDSNGYGDYYGYDVYRHDIVVRPALHLDLSVHPLTKVGTVTATANGNEYHGNVPVPTDDAVNPKATSAPDATGKPSPTPVPADPGVYKSVIYYTDNDWKLWSGEADETEVIAKNAKVTGPGQYTVELDLSRTETGSGNGIAFMAVDVQDPAEYYHPDRYICLDGIKLNGEKVPDRILEKAYTCSNNGKDTRVNLYNQWVPKDDACSREDARAIGRLEDASPYLLEDYIEEEISSIEVTFTYGTLEEINQVDQNPTAHPTVPSSKPTPSPTNRPEPSDKPDRTPDAYHTSKPKDTPYQEDTLEPTYTPEETLEPTRTPEPEESELPDNTEKPDQNDNDDDLTDDMPNRNLKVRGLDIATGNVVKKGFLTVPRVQLSWDNNRNCDGYEIWKKTGKQSFAKVDYVDDPDETEWFDTDVKKGNKYTYKVFGYVEEDDGTVSRANEGNSVSVKIRQTVKSCTYTAKRSGKKLKITFKKAEGTKYQIQVKYGKSGKWKKASGSLKKKIVKKVSPKKLKVRVRTGEKVNGKMKYSKWSKVKTVR